METGAVARANRQAGDELPGGVFLRDAPGKEWDARSPEDTCVLAPII